MGRFLTQNYTYAKYKEESNTNYASCSVCTAYQVHKHRYKKRHKMRCNLFYWKESTFQLNSSLKAKRQPNEGIRESKITALYRQERFFIHSKLTEHDPDVDIIKTEESFKHSSTSIMKHQKSVTTDTVPAYVKKLNGEIVLVTLLFQSMENLKKRLSQIEHIPENDILIWFYGRLLSSSVLSRVKPYDSLFIGIKGKGGMLDETIAVSRASSEHEVQEWLMKRVGLTEDYIQNVPDFQYLDGKTLFAYLDSGVHELKIRPENSYRSRTKDFVVP